MGVGLALLGRASGNPALVVLGFSGAVLHVVNHATFKGLLFLGAGAVHHATGTRELDLLGGLARAMPVTAALFLVGAAAISGLPPLNGFASEWLVFLAAFQSILGTRRDGHAAGRPGGPGAGPGRRAGRRLLRQGVRDRLPRPGPLPPRRARPRGAAHHAGPDGGAGAGLRGHRPLPGGLAARPDPRGRPSGPACRRRRWPARPTEAARGAWRISLVALVLLGRRRPCWPPGAAGGWGAPSRGADLGLRLRPPHAADAVHRLLLRRAAGAPLRLGLLPAHPGRASHAASSRATPPSTRTCRTPSSTSPSSRRWARACGVADRLRAQFGGRVQSQVVLLLLGVLGLLAWLALR